MILDEIIELLKNDDAFSTYLNISEHDPKIYPFSTSVVQDCIVYKFVPLTSDGIKEQNRIEITAISRDMYRALKILELVKSALITIGDEPKTKNILEISLNGGGTPMENESTGTVHIKANFIVKNRKVVI